MSTTRTRIVNVPHGDREFSTRGTSETEYHKRRSRMARRRQDDAEVLQALDEMASEEAERQTIMEAERWLHFQDYAWRDDDQPGRRNRDQPGQDFVPLYDELDLDPDVFGESFDPYRTLTPEDMRDLTVTQILWGDYSNDDAEQVPMLLIPGGSAR